MIMSFARTLSLAVLLSSALLLAAVSVASADTITSTVSGGLWADPGSWQGNTVPGSDDDAIVIGPVQVSGVISCHNLTVETAGSVSAAEAPNPRTLRVYGAVVNGGAITDNGFYSFDLELHGDILNAGTWSTHLVTLMGDGDREIIDTSPAGFDSEFATAPGVSGDITVTTPATFEGFIDFSGYRVILQPGSHLTLPATKLSGEIMAAGNEVRCGSWTFLENCTLDDAVLVGPVEATFNVLFTTRLEVKGLLQNGTGGGAATVDGDLINHGTIRNDQYSFFFKVHGDVENHGTIDTPQLSLEGVGVTHRLTMGPDASMGATVFLPEFQASTLVATTPVTLDGGLGLGVGTLILEPGASAHFPNHGGVSGFAGTIEANGNTITTEGTNSAISEVTVVRGVFGDAAVVSDVMFTEGLTVTGALKGNTWVDADITVEGRLRVEGSTEDFGAPLRITVLNDLENLGSMTNSRVTLAGTVDQLVGAGSGIAVPEFVLESGLNAASYQWYRDGAMLDGETGPSLTFNTVSITDYGRYHCEGDGLDSRNVFIAQLLDTTDVPVAQLAALEQNHPNPFNPATNIAFSLDRAGPVSLVVYDLAGREVDRLVSGERQVGRHVVTWQPRGMASGTYVYRLRADGVDVSRKCSLLK